MSVGAYRVIRSAPTVFVRTARHPAVEDLAAEGVTFESMDAIYDSSDTFDEVYAKIADKIIQEARKGDVVYAVPGHPLVGESAVRILIREARRIGLELELIGSESFIEASLEMIEIGMDEGLKILDALSLNRFAVDTDLGNLIYQVYDRAIASDVKLALMEHYPDDYEIILLHGGAPPDERTKTIPLFMLDRCDCDHLTSVYVPPMSQDQIASDS